MRQHIKNQFKFCPFCGSNDSFIFDDFKVFNCSSCKRSYFVNAAAACGAIIETPQGILFVSRKYDPKKGLLDLPGGFIDLHERVEVAIRRELQEELMFVPDNLEFFASFPNDYEYDGINYTTLDLYFYSKIDYMPNATASDDANEIFYVKREDIDVNSLAFKSSINIINTLLGN